MSHLQIYDSGVITEAAGADVTVQFTLGKGTFQLMSVRLLVVQAAPKGAIPVEVRNLIKKSDGSYLSMGVGGGYATQMHPFSLSTQPIVFGLGRIIVKSVAASASDAHRITATYRRVRE